MSLIQLSCSKCGKRLSAPASFAGKQARCPACKNVMVVPHIDPSDAVSSPGHDAHTSPAPRKSTTATPEFQEWIRSYVRTKLNIYTSDSFSVTPEIPARIGQIVRKAYVTCEQGEQILAIYDETYTGNCKQGLTITDRQIAWNTKTGPEKIGNMTLCDVEQVSFKVGKLSTIYTLHSRGQQHRIELNMSMADSDVAPAIGLLLQGIVQRVYGVDMFAHTPLVKWPGLGCCSTEEVVIQTLKASKAGNLFIAPDIPQKQLSNAKIKYLKLKTGEKPLALYDDTVLGSGKSGFCMTDQRLIWTSEGTTYELSYSDIIDVRLGSKMVSIEAMGMQYTLKMIQWDQLVTEDVALALARLLYVKKDKPPSEFLLVSRCVIVNISGTQMESIGTLILTLRNIVWLPDEEIKGFTIPSLEVRRLSQSGGNVVIETRRDAHVTIGLGKPAKRWVQTAKRAGYDAMRVWFLREGNSSSFLSHGAPSHHTSPEEQAPIHPNLSPEKPIPTEPTSTASTSSQDKNALVSLSKAIFHFSYAAGIVTMGISCPLNLDKGIGAAGAAFENGVEITLFGWLVALVLYLIGRKKK